MRMNYDLFFYYLLKKLEKQEKINPYGWHCQSNAKNRDDEPHLQYLSMYSIKIGVCYGISMSVVNDIASYSIDIQLYIK